MFDISAHVKVIGMQILSGLIALFVFHPLGSQCFLTVGLFVQRKSKEWEYDQGISLTAVYEVEWDACLIYSDNAVLV